MNSSESWRKPSQLAKSLRNGGLAVRYARNQLLVVQNTLTVVEGWYAQRGKTLPGYGEGDFNRLNNFQRKLNYLISIKHPDQCTLVWPIEQSYWWNERKSQKPSLQQFSNVRQLTTDVSVILMDAELVRPANQIKDWDLPATRSLSEIRNGINIANIPGISSSFQGKSFDDAIKQYVEDLRDAYMVTTASNRIF